MATTTNSRSGVPQVFFILLDRVNLLDLSGPAHVFRAADALGVSYQLRFCAADKVEVVSGLGLHLCKLERARETRPQAQDLVFVPGVDEGITGRSSGAQLSQWLNEAHRRGATVCSVCTGAFALAQAGLLDGRRSTTHWSRVEDLRAAAPRSNVQSDVLFVQDGSVYTSAGVSSGIDLALSILEARHGALLATRVARELVVYMRRDGGQPQSSVYLNHRNHLRAGVHRVQDWLTANPSRRATLPELAKIAALSPRHLSRVFRAAAGVTIGHYATLLRLERARSLRSNPELTQSAIAAKCGFQNARQLRRLQARNRLSTSIRR